MCLAGMVDVSFALATNKTISIHSSNIFPVLKCLQVILADESKALEPDCKSKLEKRMEMFRNAAPVSDIF